MKILLKLIIGFFSVIGILVVITVSIKVLHLNGLLGYSDTFNSIDRNNDDKLSYSEWMSYYSYSNHSHHLGECGRSDFYQADCNVDDALTWMEYHNFRFKRKSCNTIEKGEWAPPGNTVVFQESEIDPPHSLQALSANQRHWPQEYRSFIKERMQKLTYREAELMKKYGITRP